MARAATAPVNPEVLKWARLAADFGLADAARAVGVKADRLEAWESGDSVPTINQARKLATTYRRTLATFFLERVPEEDPRRPPDFRNRKGQRIGPALMRELSKARERRASFLELHGEPTGHLPSVGDVLAHPEAAAETVRELTDISHGAQAKFRDAQEALNTWIRVVEDLGVLVFHMSRVDPSECRGLSWYEPLQPLIILNGADEPEGRVFTLFHELAHLLHQSGAVCEVWRGAGTERLCNQFAGAFLMPRHDVEQALVSAGAGTSENLAALAGEFRVSQSAVAVRLRDLGVIGQQRLEEHLAVAERLGADRRERERQRQRESPGGPPHHLLHLRNLGATYVSTVLDALHSEAIGPVDAAIFLESKLSTVDRMETELVRRSRA